MADVFITDITQTSEIDDNIELVGDNGSKTYSFTAPTLKKYITKDFVRPNLLDNWYFIKPVNQRKETEYTEGGVCVDRWIRTSGRGCTVSVVDGGLKIENNSASNVYFRQYFETPISVKEFTLSVLTTEVVGSPTCYLGYDEGTGGGGSVTVGLSSKSSVLSSAKTATRFQFTIPSGASVTLKAVKLEIGNTQTLAQQDTSGEWILNEIPDYDKQLAKCQRHFVRFANFGSYLRSLGTGLVTNTAGTNARFSIPIPVPMRTKPSISVSSYSSVYCYRAGTRASVTELKVIDVQGDMGNVIVVDATTSGLTAQEICNLAVASCTIEFSAEITA